MIYSPDHRKLGRAFIRAEKLKNFKMSVYHKAAVVGVIGGVIGAGVIYWTLLAVLLAAFG